MYPYVKKKPVLRTRYNDTQVPDALVLGKKKIIYFVVFSNIRFLKLNVQISMIGVCSNI